MMKRRMAVFALMLLSPQGRGFAASPSDLVVHEWGTFTSLQGANGEVQEGMHHEESTLPAFVHGRDPLHETRPSTPNGRPPRRHPCRFKCMEIEPIPEAGLGVTQKMETPVLYFYSPTEKDVHIEVSFPRGIISQYYPNPTEFSPAIGAIKSLSGGSVRFDVKLMTQPLPLPEAAPDSVYAPARHVASNFLQSGKENERLIFYRGLGNFRTAFQALSSGGNLSLVNNDSDPVRSAFLVYVTEDGGNIISLGEIRGRGSRAVSSLEIQSLKNQTQPETTFLQAADRLLTSALRETGLFADEAQAMTNTWKTSYFRTPGLRVLYMLSRAETDQILPINIQPQPKELVRTLVGRVEIMLDTEEQTLLRAIRKDRDGFSSAELGRFAEPKLRRLLDGSDVNLDEKALIRRLVSRLPK